MEGRGGIRSPRTQRLGRDVGLPRPPSLHHAYWALTKCQAEEDTSSFQDGGGESQITTVQRGGCRPRGSLGVPKPEWEGAIREGFLEEVTFEH